MGLSESLSVSPLATPDATNRETLQQAATLYRFYDADGAILYIGVTSVGPSRWTDHEANRVWWSQVVGVSVEQYPDRETAFRAERAAIIAEQPPFNTQHKTPSEPRPRPTRAPNGAGTVIERPDGRWAFVCREDGKQRWFNVRSEAEARLLQTCFQGRGLKAATRERAIAMLSEGL